MTDVKTSIKTNIKQQENKIQDKVEKTEQIPMSDADIKFYIPNTRILKYSELSKYPSLEMLLPKSVDAIVILYESQPNSGHWTAISASGHSNQRLYTYFDSYGNSPDTPLKWNTTQQNMGLHQDKPYLSNLLRGTNWIYNKIHFQKEKDRKAGIDQINSCGRYVTFFVMSVLDKHMTLKEFQNMMKQLKNHYNKTYDECISFIITR